MKVLLYADLDVSLPGGLETHLRELATALTARGHDVDLYARPVPFEPLSTVASFDPASYDVIHHHAGTWPAALDAGERYVRTFHFCVAAKMEAYVRMGRLRTLANPGNWRALTKEHAATRRAGRFIVVSRRLQSELARLHRLNAERTTVISNGARFARPQEGREAWRARHGIPGSLPVLLTIGRRDFVKGHDLLQRAWRRLLGAGLEALWIRVGDDTPSRQHGIWTTGPLPQEQVSEWIAAADVGAFPSYYEGGGIALLDMLAGGLYTLAHDVGIAPEVVGDGTGEIVPPREAAWTAALARALAAPNHPRVPGLGPEYGWDRIAARTEAVYREAQSGVVDARRPTERLGTR
jgi:glycosyltransferase involved in cell wall biosynthesis